MTNKATYQYMKAEKLCLQSFPEKHIYLYNNDLFAYLGVNKMSIGPAIWWNKAEEGRINRRDFLNLIQDNINKKEESIFLFEKQDLTLLPKSVDAKSSYTRDKLAQLLINNSFVKADYNQCNRYFTVFIQETK
jgi:hypothetical protein